MEKWYDVVVGCDFVEDLSVDEQNEFIDNLYSSMDLSKYNLESEASGQNGIGADFIWNVDRPGRTVKWDMESQYETFFDIVESSTSEEDAIQKMEKAMVDYFEAHIDEAEEDEDEDDEEDW